MRALYAPRALRRRSVWVAAGSTMIAMWALGWFLLPNPARATGQPGSALGSYELSATAAGLQGSYATAGSSSATAEGELPYAQSQLDSTPFGEGIASIAWPGAIPANAGTTAVVLGAPLPNNYADDLNDPVRAQAETGTDQPHVTNNTYPGTTMAASATAQQVTAEGDVDSSAAPAGGFTTGNVSSASSAALTGAAQATVTAVSRVTDLQVAGGLITIKSVVSQASATSTGSSATSTGGTVISGVSIAGVPATIDQSGLHLASAGDGGATPAAVAAANQALSAAQVKVLPGEPVQSHQAGDASYTAGSVLIEWSPGGSGLFTVDVGGVSVSAAATAGYASPIFGSSTGSGTVGGSTPTGAGGATESATVAARTVAGSSFGAGNPAGTGGGSAGATLPVTGPAVGTGGAAAASGTAPASGPSAGLPGPAAALVSVSKPVSAGWLVLAILGTLCVAAGLVGLPDRLLAEGGAACKLEEFT